MTDVAITMLGRLDPSRVPEFIAILERYGCPLQIAHRHADSMMTAHQKTTKVRPWIKFDELKAELDAIGIALDIERET